MRFFIDDLDISLQKYYDRTLELGSEREANDTDKLIEGYLKQKFEIFVNQQAVIYKMLGKELEEDALYVYLEAFDVSKIEQIKIRASMLIEQFPEQENIIQLHINNQSKSLVLIKENDTGLLHF